MASILKQLSDEDIEAVNHMIRRDAHTDLQIAEEAEKRLKTSRPSCSKHPDSEQKIAKGAKAKESIIQRYRKSKEYTGWLKRWENQDVDLKKDIALQKQRFELLSNLVKDPDSNGMETLSKSLQARLLTLAAESTDKELIEGAKARGWIKSVIKVIQDQAKMEKTAVGEKALGICQDKKLSEDERERRMKEIFGL